MKPYLSEVARRGSRSVVHQLGTEGVSGSQRSEHLIVGGHDISEGDEYFTGLSVRLEPGYPKPGSWHVLHQIQQAPAVPRPGSNNPMITLNLDAETDKLQIHWRTGEDGRDGKYLGRKAVIDFEEGPLRRGVWYDLIVGWKYSPDSNDGWVHVYIKRSDQPQYTRYAFENLRVGFTDAPDMIWQNKFGLYKGGDGQKHVAYFDEVRFATSREDARIPGSRF
ncbi:heparin lyase I family protein [Algisphaera agarilytica]|uniref:Polysaccharide lyase n=1 Tax=Algisphaera agarilytica TaxID=1385975 RepID=A0A7X0H9J3_9BACT|nr:heparin lyase I family protein [Algisphaera agarilytica]MBB6431578.1 hypothetical protein [Algisphaera agarilytica]